MKQKSTTGSGLIFAVVLLFVILGMVITLSSVTVLETKMSQKTKSSVGAFYNSESGVEWALSQISNATGPNISDAFPGFSGNKYPCPSGFNCDMYFLDETGNIIASNITIDKVKAVRSVGTQSVGGTADSQRAIEAAVASGGGGCYVSYKTGCSDGPPITSGCCVTGFINKGSAGKWGGCSYNFPPLSFYNRPPSGSCAPSWTSFDSGDAYVCCQS